VDYQQEQCIPDCAPMDQGEDDWIKCPYNITHVMPPSRFQWHVVKCPDKKQKGHLFTTCPFNAQHILIKSELENHKMKCPDREQRNFVKEDFSEIDSQIRQYLATEYKPNTSSDWGNSSSQSWMPAQEPIVGQTEYVYQSQTKRTPKRRGNKHDREHNEDQQSTSPTKQGVTSHETIQSQSPKESSKKIKPDTHEVTSPVVKTTEFPNNESSPKEGPMEIQRKKKAVQKKLAQISDLEKKLKEGGQLNEDQTSKLARKKELEQELKSLTL